MAEKKVVKRKLYYDLNTKNASFVKLSKILKDLGISNNKFHLAIYDKDLIGVDPYDPDLSLEMKSKILNEVKHNYWYFIREVVRIPVAGGVKTYEIHRGNLAISWCLLNNIKAIIELPRQNYKSISIAIFYLWVFSFGTVNSEMMLMNKKFEDSKTNLKRIREIRDKLPDYLQIIHSRDKCNLTEQVSEINRNTLIAKSTANDEASADGCGRGCTQPCQWYDEFAFLKYNEIIFA